LKPSLGKYGGSVLVYKSYAPPINNLGGSDDKVNKVMYKNRIGGDIR
jgi:hypothetical protein